MNAIRTEVGRVAVVYRATATTGREVELRLSMPAAEATMADAWRRLSALHGPVDPRSLEIEMRQLADVRAASGPRLVAASASSASTSARARAAASALTGP